MSQILQKPQTEEEATICGLHSGIPLCCVFWYLQGWQSMRDEGFPRNFNKNEYRYDRRDKNILGIYYLTWLHLDGLEYVACPDCIARITLDKIKPIKVKKCQCATKTQESQS